MLASFPRSGNTFLRNILLDVFGVFTFNNVQVYSKGMRQIRKYERMKRFRALSRKGERRLQKLKKKYAYQVVKTHDLPKNILPVCHPNVKKIYIIRDGRDSLVSMAHHRKDIVEPGTDYIKNLKEALWAPMGSYFGGWGANVEEWSEIADRVIYFEDLVDKPEEEIRKLQKLLDLPEPDMDKIPTFESQRKGKSLYGGRIRPKLSREEQDAFNAKFYRSGKKGGWKNEMPEDIQEKFWEKYGDTMLKHGYSIEEGRKT